MSRTLPRDVSYLSAVGVPAAIARPTAAQSHTRVRGPTRAPSVTYRVELQLPVDVSGVYVYVPKG